MTNSKTSIFFFSIAFFFLKLTFSYSQDNKNDSDPKKSYKNKPIIKYDGEISKFNSASVIDSLTNEISELKSKMDSLQKSLNIKIDEKNSQHREDVKRTEAVGALFLIFTVISIGVIRIRLKKRSILVKSGATILREENEAKQSQIDNQRVKEDSLNKEIEELKKEIQSLKQISPVKNKNKSTFFGQVLLSAGPRKSSRDSELGEDSAGFCVNGDRAFFWILDGTSDSPIIAHGRKEIMSSRLLAQHLGINLQKTIPNNDLDSQSWLINAIQSTEKQWQQTFSELSAEAKKSVIEDLAGRADIADVSTTALVGIIDTNGKASIARIGDSKVFCLNQDDKLIGDELTQRPPSDLYSRLYARATQDKDSISLHLTKSSDILRLHGSTLESVKTVLAFSDGIGPITENFLREHFDKFHIEDVQQSIASIPQQTYDDKSLVMLQIRE